ncbi:hypothetical protein GOBAR_AA07916 [Gossypium barbadense]|uniref:Arabidopsis retrotransposon Orf1 C-terminal domain-containing protein n=1 Tax=Gossypium barbadense TaxID=3634 RepID=A0A2P5YAU2_GOSBA|nr:hypothetical protein GOBAR_AA07916 [Gossypium barbadense]
MLKKFISVSETRFQNTETILKNEQVSIQGFETQIGQLVKLISERPKHSLPSNTKFNPRKQLNATVIQDEEGLVAEPRPETVVSKCSKNIHKPSNNKKPIHEERMLQIEELDEWWTHKPRKYDKPKPRHDELNTSPNQLKVGDKVLLDAADPRITTSEPNEEIPLTVFSIFSYGTVEVIHPKFGTFKILRARPLGVDRYIDWTTLEQVQLVDDVRALLTTDPWEVFFAIIEPTFLERTLELCLTFHVQDVITNFDDPGTVQFRLGSLVYQLSVPEFSIALGLYTEEFMEDNELNTLHRHIYYSPSKCWRALVPNSASYDPNRSKASALSPSLRYLHVILAHTLTAQQESTGIVNTHDAYFLWSMANRHMKRHRRGVISIGPYVTRLALHFEILNTAAQSSSLTLIGQMSPQGILSMLHMRMIEKRRETHPPQYCLAQSAEEKDPEDIIDDVPPRHKDPPTQPPPPSRPVYVAASYADISERLT